jgi:MFS family permease
MRMGRHEPPRTTCGFIVTVPGNTTSGITAPLRHRLFWEVWIAGVLSNLGTQIQAVSAAWAMTQLTNEAGLIALVQSATMLPTMIFAMVAGTLADLFDRRKVAVLGLGLATLAAAALAVLWMLNAVNAGLLLVFCFVVSTGTTWYGPAWQASVREQVPREAMASASISYILAAASAPQWAG